MRSYVKEIQQIKGPTEKGGTLLIETKNRKTNFKNMVVKVLVIIVLLLLLIHLLTYNIIGILIIIFSLE